MANIETTTLMSANGTPYTRQIPTIIIRSYFNETALENLRKQTGIDFHINAWHNIEGQPETWEQFAKIFLTYNFITHSQYNGDGNYLYLTFNSSPITVTDFYYTYNGEKYSCN